VPRKNEGLLFELSLLPWWVSATIAAVATPPFELDADGIARAPEFLGEYSLEEAEQLGAFFDDPAELEAFERALADEQARKAASN